MSTYADRLEATKEFFPFSLWATFDDEMEQYSEQNCAVAEAILDRLLAELAAIGEHASEAAKVAKFRESVEALNALNEDIGGNFIETGEREELCELYDRIASVAGLDPRRYGGGEGLASEWREW
jgi:hypothetical protein